MSGPRFVKMAGAGNDFVVLDPEAARALGGTLRSWIRLVCRRGVSVGADGVLVVRPAGTDRVRVDFYNPDGGVAFCGNGTRCAARFARLQGWTGDRLVAETTAGEVPAEIRGATVRLTLPAPEDCGEATLESPAGRFTGRWVRAGVPHFVIEMADVAAAPLAAIGPGFRRHPHFGADGANVDLVQWHAAERLSVRTWERGVEGETLCCGTGAVAAALVARLRGAGEVVRVVPASGIELTVTLPGRPEAPDRVLLEGDARVVFEGTLSTEAVEPER